MDDDLFDWDEDLFDGSSPWERGEAAPTEQIEALRKVQAGTHWRTRDGRLIAIGDMEDTHLINTVHFLERTHERTPLPLVHEKLIEEGKRRGLFVDVEIDHKTPDGRRDTRTARLDTDD